MSNFYIGVDAGGTKCRSRLIDSNGQIIGTGEAGPANAKYGTEAVFSEIMACVTEAFDQAGLTQGQRLSVSAGFGIAGISRPGAKEALEAKPFPFHSTKIDSDAAIASLGALGGGDGAILIVGTGSVGFLKFGEITEKIGGYGFPISDEGSGAALGLSVMRHTLRALDGRTRTTPLASAIAASFDHDPVKAIRWMDNATAADYAKFAPTVIEYAEANDEIAISILSEAVLHIERFIEVIFNKGARKCVMLGGLAGPLRPWLRERTVRRLSEPWGDALDGALHLAGFSKQEMEKSR